MEVFLWTSCMSDKPKSVATLFCNLTSLSGMLFFMATCSDHLNFQGLPWDLLFSWRSPVACCLYLSVLLPLLPLVFVVYCLCYCFYSTCCSLCLRVLYSLSSRNISIYLIWKESLKFSQYSLVWMFLFFVKLLITLALVQREDNTRIGLAGVEIMDCSVDWSLGTYYFAVFYTWRFTIAIYRLFLMHGKQKHNRKLLKPPLLSKYRKSDRGLSLLIAVLIAI